MRNNRLTIAYLKALPCEEGWNIQRELIDAYISHEAPGVFIAYKEVKKNSDRMILSCRVVYVPDALNPANTFDIFFRVISDVSAAKIRQKTNSFVLSIHSTTPKEIILMVGIPKKGKKMKVKLPQKVLNFYS